MSSSPEMSVINLKIHKGLLYCTYCQYPCRPDKWCGMPYMCAGGHIFCRDCKSSHEKACISCCLLLNRIMAKMEFKCNLCDSGNVPYGKFVGHVCDTPLAPEVVNRQLESVFELGECTLNANLLACSECNLLLRPPIFRHLSRDKSVCSACYCGDINNYIHDRELDYLVQGITVKCVACEEYLPFFTLALHQLDDCPFKHKLQKIARLKCPEKLVWSSVLNSRQRNPQKKISCWAQTNHRDSPPLVVATTTKNTPTVQLPFHGGHPALAKLPVVSPLPLPAVSPLSLRRVAQARLRRSATSGLTSPVRHQQRCS